MSDVQIRSYRSADLTACRSLWIELTQTYRDLYESPGIGGDDPGAQFDEHLERVGADHVWVAEAGGLVVGLTGLIADPETPEADPLVVTHARRGEGIGRLLLARVVAAAKEAGLGTLSVKVAARNRSAVEFYHEQDFRIVGDVELMKDFREEGRPWRPGNPLEGRAFLV